MQDELARLVIDRWKKADEALLEDRRNYWLNYAFYEGHQWVWFDPTRNVVENAAPISGYESDRVRMTVNKIQERVNQLIGRYTARPLTFEAQPSAADDATLSGARLGERTLEAARVDNDWESIRRENIFNTLVGATAAISVEWDGSSGEQLMLRSTNNTIVGSGEVKLTPLSIAEFSVEPRVRRWQDAKWYVACTAVPPEVVKDHFNLSDTPRADAGGAFSPLQRTLLGKRGIGEKDDLAAVYVMVEVPRGGKPGRRVVVVNDRTIHTARYDEPELPIVVFRQQARPMIWTGTTVLTAARPVQVAYNAVFSTIVEHAKLAGNARLMVPFGGLADDTQLTDEPGEILNYYPDQGRGPEYLRPPELPRWLTNLPAELEAQLDGILHSHAVSRGLAPGDRNSGLALSILAEKNDTPLGPMAHDQAQGWARIGTKVLEMYAAKAPEVRRKVVYTDTGVPVPFEWNAARLHGQTRVTVPLESTLPTNRTATQALLTNLANAFPQFGAMLDGDKVVRMLDIPGGRMLSEVLDHHVRRAQKENDLMAVGQVILPEKWEDHARHIAEHNRFRDQDAYRHAPAEVRAMVDAHIEAHQRLVEEETVAQAALNAIQPGFAALPQANEPVGSAVPRDSISQQGV